MDYKKYVADVKDFPIDGILFRDVTPLIQDGEAFDSVCNDFAEFAKEVGADIIVGPEARGFIFGCPVACKLKKGFVPIRKPNKLPRETVSMSYDLEYGSNVLCMHKDSIKPGQKVLIIDDLLATGGTTVTAAKLVESLGGVVAGFAFLVELTDLKGRELIKDYKVLSLIKY